ncbi:hypothetical protein B0H13DRAFT_1897963 [Mycena leptocephala]|nr:hypothetical protein B0H13DRAFT_1897963 [Mycena leptocephala]
MPQCVQLAAWPRGFFFFFVALVLNTNQGSSRSHRDFICSSGFTRGFNRGYTIPENIDEEIPQSLSPTKHCPTTQKMTLGLSLTHGHIVDVSGHHELTLMQKPLSLKRRLESIWELESAASNGGGRGGGRGVLFDLTVPDTAAEAAELSDTDRLLLSTIITSSGGARGEISVSEISGRAGRVCVHGRAGVRMACVRAEAFASRRNRRELVAAGQGQLANGGYKTSGGMARSRSALISRQVFVWCAWWRARGRARNRRQENAAVGRDGGEVVDERRRVWWRCGGKYNVPAIRSKAAHSGNVPAAAPNVPPDAVLSTSLRGLVTTVRAGGGGQRSDLRFELLRLVHGWWRSLPISGYGQSKFDAKQGYVDFEFILAKSDLRASSLQIGQVCRSVPTGAWAVERLGPNFGEDQFNP